MLQIHVRRSGCGHQLLGDQGWCWGLGVVDNSGPTAPQQQDWILGRAPHCSAALIAAWARTDRREGDRSLAPGDALHYHCSLPSHWSPGLFPGF